MLLLFHWDRLCNHDQQKKYSVSVPSLVLKLKYTYKTLVLVHCGNVAGINLNKVLEEGSFHSFRVV